MLLARAARANSHASALEPASRVFSYRSRGKTPLPDKGSGGESGRQSIRRSGHFRDCPEPRNTATADAWLDGRQYSSRQSSLLAPYEVGA